LVKEQEKYSRVPSRYFAFVVRCKIFKGDVASQCCYVSSFRALI